MSQKQLTYTQTLPQINHNNNKQKVQFNIQQQRQQLQQQQINSPQQPYKDKIKPNVFQHHDKDPNNRLNKYFIDKYETSLPIIKQFQQERENMDTPFLNAQKSLKSIVESEMTQQLQTYSSFNPPGTQSQKKLSMGLNSTKNSNLNQNNTNNINFNATNRSNSITQKTTRNNLSVYNDTQYTRRSLASQDIMLTFDKSKIKDLEESLSTICEYSKNLGNSIPPNFQNHWQIVFEIELEQAASCFRKWQEHINTAILLDAAVISVAQCIWGEFHFQGGIQSPQEQKSQDLIDSMLQLIYQNFLIIVDKLSQHKLIKEQESENVWQGSLEKTIEQKKIRNMRDDYLFELKRNNEFVTTQIKELIKIQQIKVSQQNKEQQKLHKPKSQIKPIFLVIQHSLRTKNKEEVKKLRENIVNGTFLTMMKPVEIEESPLKSIYMVFEDSPMYLEHSQYSQEDDDGHPQPPFLPEKTNQSEYTLVLDLDETLGHYNQETQIFQERPFLKEFLEAMKDHFEVIIFTAGIQEYADQVLDVIDPSKIIEHRLYRQHTFYENNNFVKDLSLIGRDLQKTIIVDNNHTNFKYQPENAIFIRTWINEDDDIELFHLKNLLTKIAVKKSEDLREALKQYRDFIVRKISCGVVNPHTNI